MASSAAVESFHPGSPDGGWTAHIDDVRAGRWINPKTGERAPRAPVDHIAIAESLEGAEAEMVGACGLRGALAIVADPDTWDAMGARIAAALRRARRKVREVILERRPHATLAEAAVLVERLSDVGGVVVVGSGTLNDLGKYATAQEGRSCCVFGTAASMDGYTSQTASMRLESGLKISVPAHAPKGVFLDLGVLAAAPPHMAAAGFGDCLCSSVARIDWWMSHRLLGTPYHEEPYLIAQADAAELNARAGGVRAGEIEAIGYLARSLTLSGLGCNFTGVSNHGSMGEHQISHYIDCFAGGRHPGTLHGQQVGVATLTMARIQQRLLGEAHPPRLRPTRIDSDDMARRMGPEIAKQCEAQYRGKALDGDGAARLNARLAEIWPDLRRECLHFAEPVGEMHARLAAAGGPTTAEELGLPTALYREAVRHAHEMRNRFSFADLACDAGLLDDLAAAEV